MTGAPIPAAGAAPAGEGAPEPVTGDGIVGTIAGASGEAPPANDFISTIPDEYKDKPYMKDVTGIEGILKQLDGAQSLIGAPKIPKEDAPKEDWDKFYSSIGRPETPEGYSLLVEGDAEPTKQVNETMQQVFYEAGLTKAQSDKISEKFKEVANSIAPVTEDIEKYNAAFQAETEKIFGADREGAIAVATSLVKEYAPDAVKQQLAELSPEAMAGVAAVLKGVSDKYISSDDITKIKGGSHIGSANTADGLRKEMREIMNSKVFTNPMHGLEHKEAVAKVDTISKQIAKLEQTK